MIKLKRDHLAALHRFIPPGPNESYPSSLKELEDRTTELLWGSQRHPGRRGEGRSVSLDTQPDL